MDTALTQALDFSSYIQTLTIQRKLCREKLDLRLTYGYAGGLFKIDRALLSFIQMLIDRGRLENVPLIDVNNNPVLVTDVVQFREDIFDRYFTALTDYLVEYEKIKKSRSVEKLTAI